VHLNEVHPTALEKLQAIGGLTFYKDFTRIVPGTYSGAGYAGLLNADYSVGSGVATFTSTSGSFTITANGYNATTVNDEVLKYLIAGNRTAEQETIVIKFTPTGDFANDGVIRMILSNDGSVRQIRKEATGTVISFFPNLTDSAGVNKSGTTTLLDNVSYLLIISCTNSPSTYQIFANNSQEGTTGTDAWTVNTFSGSFYIGSTATGTLQANGYIEKLLFFNRDLSTSEKTVIYNLLR